MLHILARIASYLEDGIEQTNSVGFSTYVNRKRSSKTYDIEHILADEYSVFVTSNEEANQDLEQSLNIRPKEIKLGGLTLLPRSRNRSLKDKPFSEKVSKYTSENVLAQSLSSDFYDNNPQVDKFIEIESINLQPYSIFNKSALYERHELYKEIINKIWSIESITS